MYTRSHRKCNSAGYTLVELLVVIVIIMLLSAAVSVAVFNQLQKGRDAERQADLQTMKAAIEQYRQQNGRYPAMGCTAVGGWSRQQDCYEFVSGLATVLPQIPRDPGNGDGYVYRTNANGTVFKLMARGTVEGTVTPDDSLQACDKNLCSSSCTGSSNYSRSYAVWGGFADGNSDAAVRSATSNVICAM